MPTIRDDIRTISWWLVVGLVVGGVVGGIVGGIGGRLVMLILRLTSNADGIVSDDGFTIGEFSVFDSSQLYAAAALGGAINGLLYVLARRVLPRRLRVPLWGPTGAAVVGGGVVHTDGVDFNVLEPRWFAVAAFVALPALAALAVAWIVERVARIEPWQCSPWAALLVIPAAPGLLAAPAAIVGGAVVLLAGRAAPARRLLDTMFARVVALGLVVAAIVASGVDLARDTEQLLFVVIVV